MQVSPLKGRGVTEAREYADLLLRGGEWSADNWAVREIGGGRWNWIEVARKDAPQKEQGWKLHVSATVDSAPSVLEVILPLLQASGVSFKVCRSVSDLEFLNSGKAGLSQIGKFVTIYPNDDDQFVLLALELDQLTVPLEGPTIPSDRPIRVGSLVHYRYGSFITRTYQNSLGQVVPGLRTPDGQIAEDIHSTLFQPPSWAVDPLESRSLLPPFRPESPLINQRYLCLAVLYQSAKGILYIAVDADSDEAQECIVKRAHRKIFLDAGRIDAPTMLRNEKSVLERLQGHDCFPKALDFFEQDGDSYLVLAYEKGMDLRTLVLARSSLGLLFKEGEVLDFAVKLCHILRLLHTNGIIHRDLKPGNLLLTEEGDLKLLDFEIAFDRTRSNPAFPLAGTRGYRSPQQCEGLNPSVTDDIFGLGALLHFLSTNCDPSLAPREWVISQSKIATLNPDIKEPLQSLIARCLAVKVEERFSDIDEVANALAYTGRSSRVSKDHPARQPAVVGTIPYLSFAEHLGEQICELAQPIDVGVSWLSTHEFTCGSRLRDICVGASGIGLFVLDLYVHTERDIFRKTAEKASEWLLDIQHENREFLPGLYVGESGVGLFILRLGQTLGIRKYIQAGKKIAHAIWTKLPASPDLFNGLAGCGLYFLILGEATKDDDLLERAGQIGDRLLELADCNNGRCRWVIPPGYQSLSGQYYLGFAHGAAGIGYFLLELYDVTRCGKYRECALMAAEYIMSMAEAGLNDGTGINWPDREGGDIQSLYWCHGASGIGRFFLRSYEICGRPDHLDIARRAALLVAKGGRWLNPTQCHGLSGNIEFLLDMYQATGEQLWLAESNTLAEILASQAVELNGHILWPSEEPTIITPDFMVGYAGVGECFLRLAAAGSHPHLLSRQYFETGLL